jgi:hypothetical protein
MASQRVHRLSIRLCRPGSILGPQQNWLDAGAHAGSREPGCTHCSELTAASDGSGGRGRLLVLGLDGRERLYGTKNLLSIDNFLVTVDAWSG